MVASHAAVAQCDIWWAEFGTPVGSAPGYDRPVVVVQSNIINATRLKTYLCVPMTGNLKHAQAPWNLLLTAEATGLPRDSLAQANQLMTLDETQLTERIGRIRSGDLNKLFGRLDVALDRA